MTRRLLTTVTVAAALALGPAAAPANAITLDEVVQLGSQGLQVGQRVLGILWTGSGGDFLDYMTCSPDVYPVACGIIPPR